MVPKAIKSAKDLKGKRIAVSQIGDAPYNYTVALLGKFGLKPRDVQWIPVGTDATARAVALTSGRADATLLTAPAYFKLEEARLQEHREYGRLQRHLRLNGVSVHAEKRSRRIRRCRNSIIKAQAEAIKRFYDDKAFAVKAYIAYDKQDPADVERIYDHTRESQRAGTHSVRHGRGDQVRSWIRRIRRQQLN